MERHVDDARERGAELLHGGGRLEGQFFQPSVLTGVPADAAMSCEAFGPVAGIALRRRGGRGAGRQRHPVRARGVLLLAVERADLARVEALEYGIVGINTGFISTEVAPFGG